MAVDVWHRLGDEGYVRLVEGCPEGAGNFRDPLYAEVGEAAGS